MGRSRARMLLAALALAACGGDDGAPDAAVPAPDATPSAPDAAPSDAAPSGSDAGPPPPGCPRTFAGCGAGTVELTGATTARVGLGEGDFYVGGCIRVKVGTSVTIEASDSHPFASAACSPAPIAAAGTTPVTFVPTAPGIYGFFCPSHGDAAGAGMAGAIEVVAAE